MLKKHYLSIAVLAAMTMNVAADARKTVSFDDISAQLDFQRSSYDKASGLGGLAWFDYDNDGDADLYLSNGPGNRNALFRNDGDDKFVDVTLQAGVGNTLGTSGVMAGDIDNDGFIDLFLIGAGGDFTPLDASASVIYRNLGNGRFADVSANAGIAPLDDNGEPLTETSVWSGAMADVDNDGDLDVYVTAPGSFFTGHQVAGKFFRNDGDFKFSEVSVAAGLGSMERGSCAAGFSDYDNDGDVDLFVANCQKFLYDPSSPGHPSPVGLESTPIQLYRNDGQLKFTDVTVESGLAAYNGNWMSVSFADMDHDGFMDVFSTNAGFTTPDEVASGIASAPHGLFKNNGDGTFSDIAESAGLAHWEMSWGSSFTDFDNDGYADIFFIGSLPIPPAFLTGAGFANPGRLFMNDNSRRKKTNRFSQNTNGGTSLGLNLAHEFTSGVAFADLNNDGFQDLAILLEQWSPSSAGQPVLLKNKGNSNRWVGINLVGTQSNRLAVGAKVMIKTGKMCQFQEVYAGSDFASTNSHRLNFGVAKHRRVGKIVVTWPGGNKELFADHRRKSNKIYQIIEGSGKPLSDKKAARMMRNCH